ncbi:MAG TPA: Na+/H+ antiporter NhaA, partial [Candidatus Saccharimonadales bacterium]|nr:Na+/H+ antiporter NhaA [Candidatus Saccharimonadales bacterium]
MHRKLKHLAGTASSLTRLPAVLRSFLRDESIAGKLVISFAVLAIVVANSPLSSYYESLWKLTLQIGVGDFVLSQDLRHWVNEGLMAIFFLVVGLEIKRELVTGELRDRKKAALPVAAAIGGMILPAAIYVAFNFDTSAIRGWGVPIAT